MDATQLIALQAASIRLTTAQAAAETAAATTATANPVVPVTTANVTVTL